MTGALIIGAAIIVAALILGPRKPGVRGGYQPKPSSEGIGSPPTSGSAVSTPLRFGAMGDFLGPIPPERHVSRPTPPPAQLVTQGASFWGLTATPQIRPKPPVNR